MTIIRCDGPRCETEIPEDAPRYTLWSQGIEVLSEFPQTDFCSLRLRRGVCRCTRQGWW